MYFYYIFLPHKKNWKQHHTITQHIRVDAKAYMCCVVFFFFHIGRHYGYLACSRNARLGMNVDIYFGLFVSFTTAANLRLCFDVRKKWIPFGGQIFFPPLCDNIKSQNWETTSNETLEITEKLMEIVHMNERNVIKRRMDLQNYWIFFLRVASYLFLSNNVVWREVKREKKNRKTKEKKINRLNPVVPFI